MVVADAAASPECSTAVEESMESLDCEREDESVKGGTEDAELETPFSATFEA